MAARIAIYLSNDILTEGVSRLLENEAGIDIAGIVKNGEDPYERIFTLNPDVLLVDFTMLYNKFNDPTSRSDLRDLKTILIDTCCGEENIINAIVTKGVKGIITSNSTSELLIKAIKAVVDEEVWFDKDIVKNLVTGMNSTKNNERTLLTDREKEVVLLIGKGYKNKEIAKKLFISEPTVKTHLHRIFQKLEVRNRPQLVTYALKHSDSLGLDHG